MCMLISYPFLQFIVLCLLCAVRHCCSLDFCCCVMLLCLFVLMLNWKLFVPHRISCSILCSSVHSCFFRFTLIFFSVIESILFFFIFSSLSLANSKHIFQMLSFCLRIYALAQRHYKVWKDDFVEIIIVSFYGQKCKKVQHENNP